MKANSHRAALIRGTTANDRSPAARLRALGAARGHVVASYLISRGVNPAQLQVIGVGAHFPEYVTPDRDPATDALLPGPAALNRSIRIALTDPCH